MGVVLVLDQLRKSDEGVIEVESSVSSGSEYQASRLEENRPRSREFGEQRGEQGKKKNLTGNQSGRKEQPVNKRKRSIGSKESLVGLTKQQHKKSRQEVTGYKRRTPQSRSAGSEGKKTRKLGRKTHKRVLSSSSTSTKPLKKRIRESKESLQQGRSSPYRL
ncbi:hypothetical protein TNCV_3262011 [Trichonephila clavipes]|nr:hypothetical protein TNCV_3262011 [Trichonephila clavipes]